MRRASRWVPWAVLAACGVFGACNGDYWLGGVRGERSGDGKDAAVDAGRNGATDAGGNALVLEADIVLRGSDSLELPKPDAGRCRIVGNGHGIRSEGAWVGRLILRDCDVENLGNASTRAISLDMSGQANMTIENVTFSGSGAMHVTTADDATVTFRNNVIADDSKVPLDPSADVTTPAFFADGAGQASKVFQGNRIYRSGAWFGSPNWLIGGDRDADGNILVGLRAELGLGASGLVVRGNYVHVLHLAGSGDEAAVTASYETVDSLAEHNVLRGGYWVFRGFGGELRYNAVLDAEVSAWLYQPFENTKVHHNLFLMCHPPREDVQAGIYLVNARAVGIEFYNNTLDGGGSTMRLSGAAIAIDDRSFLSSLRSNLVYAFPYWRNDDGAAAVRPGALEGVDPPPPRLGYADYNLFYNPEASVTRNYAVAVPGRTLRADTGFARHDARVGGPVDEQVDPGPLGMPGGCFPWSDDDIERSRVTVSQILKALRAAYTPAAGSALLRSGDPADAASNPIGAIGDGTGPEDRFGTFGQ